MRPNQQYVKPWGFSRRLLTVFTAFDVSETQNIAFLHTIGGIHSGNQQSSRCIRYCGLGTAVEKLGLKMSEALSIDFTTSSLGSLNIGFLSALYLAAQGDDGLTEYECRSSSARTAKKARDVHTIEDDIQRQVHEKFYIYYPTHDSVASSIGGHFLWGHDLLSIQCTKRSAKTPS